MPRPRGAFWRGYHLSAVDGTCLDVSDTAANRAAFGDPTDGSFPQIRLLAHGEIGTRALIDASFDTYATSEKALYERLAASFVPNMLTIFDAGLCGSDLYSTITATGAQFVLAPIMVLDDGSYTAHLKKGGSLVRVIEYTVYTEIETTQGHTSTVGETITLVTSLLEPVLTPSPTSRSCTRPTGKQRSSSTRSRPSCAAVPRCGFVPRVRAWCARRFGRCCSTRPSRI